MLDLPSVIIRSDLKGNTKAFVWRGSAEPSFLGASTMEHFIAAAYEAGWTFVRGRWYARDEYCLERERPSKILQKQNVEPANEDRFCSDSCHETVCQGVTCPHYRNQIPG